MSYPSCLLLITSCMPWYRFLYPQHAMLVHAPNGLHHSVISAFAFSTFITNIMLIKWTLHTCQASHSDAQHDLSCPVISNRDHTPASFSANCNTKQSGMSLMSVDEAPLVHIGAWRNKTKSLMTHLYQSMSRHSFRLCPASCSRGKFA